LSPEELLKMIFSDPKLKNEFENATTLTIIGCSLGKSDYPQKLINLIKSQNLKGPRTVNAANSPVFVPKSGIPELRKPRPGRPRRVIDPLGEPGSFIPFE
jgi:hypothetical protein